MKTGFVFLLVAVAVVIGIFIGVAIDRLRKKSFKSQGTIYAYYFSPESSPSLLLEYGVPIDDIASRKQVTFDVNIIRQYSHE